MTLYRLGPFGLGWLKIKILQQIWVKDTHIESHRNLWNGVQNAMSSSFVTKWTFLCCCFSERNTLNLYHIFLPISILEKQAGTDGRTDGHCELYIYMVYLTADYIQCTHGDEWVDIHEGLSDTFLKFLYQNLAIWVEHLNILLKNLEMECWCQDLAVFLPFTTYRILRIYYYQVLIFYFHQSVLQLFPFRFSWSIL